MEQKFLFEKIKDTSDLVKIQQYAKEMDKKRGFDFMDPARIMLLLMEEIGELAKIIRKDVLSMPVDKNKINDHDILEHEIADVFIVLLCLCNRLDVSIYDAFLDKESFNIHRKWSAS